MIRTKWFTFIIGCLFSLAIFAQSSPLPMLESTAKQLISALKQNKAQLKRNPKIIYSLVRRIILPHFDVVTMSRLALGRDGWQSATASQRARFTKEFVTLATRTYSTALSAYNDQEVEFKPLRGGAGESRVEVESSIVQQDGPTIPVSYRLIMQGGQWKVYDFSVEGVSMVESFRSQFAGDLSSIGLDGLIQKIANRNVSRE